MVSCFKTDEEDKDRPECFKIQIFLHVLSMYLTWNEERKKKSFMYSKQIQSENPPTRLNVKPSARHADFSLQKAVSFSGCVLFSLQQSCAHLTVP